VGGPGLGGGEWGQGGGGGTRLAKKIATQLGAKGATGSGAAISPAPAFFVNQQNFWRGPNKKNGFFPQAPGICEGPTNRGDAQNKKGKRHHPGRLFGGTRGGTKHRGRCRQSADGRFLPMGAVGCWRGPMVGKEHPQHFPVRWPPIAHGKGGPGPVARGRFFFLEGGTKKSKTNFARREK